MIALRGQVDVLGEKVIHKDTKAIAFCIFVGRSEDFGTPEGNCMRMYVTSKQLWNGTEITVHDHSGARKVAISTKPQFNRRLGMDEYECLLPQLVNMKNAQPVK